MAFNVTSFVVGAVLATGATYVGVRMFPGVMLEDVDAKSRPIAGVETSNGGCPDCGVRSFDYRDRGVLIQTKCEQVRVCTPTADGKDIVCSEWRGKS